MWKFIFGFLIFTNVALWFFVATYPDNNLHVVACDVGQGDALLIQRKTTQILIDGGAGNRITKCLDKYIPFWDRTIEIVINTHPHADHYGGLIEVLKRYKVETFTANSLNSGDIDYGVLKDEVRSKGVKVVNPTAGMKFSIAEIKIDILHPSSNWLAENLDGYQIGEINTLGTHASKVDPNEFSIVAALHYKNFDCLFTGDTQEPEEHLLTQEGLLSDIEYLKVPHHGSKSGLTKELLDATTPEIAVVSDGKNNRYGHPHKETLDLLQNAHVQTHRTDQEGDVEVVSDGERYWVQ